MQKKQSSIVTKSMQSISLKEQFAKAQSKKPIVVNGIRKYVDSDFHAGKRVYDRPRKYASKQSILTTMKLRER